MSIEIDATMSNLNGPYTAEVSTNGNSRPFALPSKAEGRGVAINGGEFMCLALASCFTNDLYREAATAGIQLAKTKVAVRANFGGRGDPAQSVDFDVWIAGEADTEKLEDLVRTTDEVAEIQNTLRLGIPVHLSNIGAESVTRPKT